MKLEISHEDLKTYGNKFHFYYHEENKTIVCTTLYKGKMIRGIAKCNPEDKFDMNSGKRLAYLRCKQKFLRKKFKRALEVEKSATIAEELAKFNLLKASKFVMDMRCQLVDINDELKNFEATLN